MSAHLFEQGISKFIELTPNYTPELLNDAISNGINNRLDVNHIVSRTRKFADLISLANTIPTIKISNLIYISTIRYDSIKDAIIKFIFDVNPDVIREQNAYYEFMVLIREVDPQLKLIKKMNIEWPENVRYDVIETLGYIKTEALEIDIEREFTNELSKNIIKLHEEGCIRNLTFGLDTTRLECLFDTYNSNSLDLVKIINIIILDKCGVMEHHSGREWMRIIKSLEFVNDKPLKSIIVNVKKINAYFIEECEKEKRAARIIELF